MLFRVAVLLLVSLMSTKLFAFAEPCQLVAQMAGNKEYKHQPMRVATMSSPERLPKAWRLSLLESHGAWYVYKTESGWMTRERCAPIVRRQGDRNFQFMPVLLNKQTGHNAVITGTFIVETYRKRDIPKVMKKYGFKMMSPLPNPRSLIVDVKPTQSYDFLIKQLDRDHDVTLALPLLSEPRPRR